MADAGGVDSVAAYHYYTCDVFSRTRFGGNPLAVFPEAEGLDDAQMQRIAREFNYSETTFVFAPSGAHTRAVRIFTPEKEIPFAGHPNIGTAFVLASTGRLGDLGDALTLTFEERAGIVPVTVRVVEEHRIVCELQAPQAPTFGPRVAVEQVAAAVGLPADAIVTTVHEPCVASVGLPFVVVELRDRDALARARVDIAALTSMTNETVPGDLLLYTRDAGDFDIRARMFAPFHGVPEDPATGSANCALAALLAHCEAARDGDFRWRIAQGVEMGRPSELHAAVRKQEGEVVATRIGGDCVLVSEGRFFIEPGAAR